MRNIAAIHLLAAAVLFAAAGGGALAQDFRVDSKVFIAKEELPHSTNVTLFHGPHIYDFLDKPQQITVYDTVRGRIVLVDPARDVKAEITSDMLAGFTRNLQLLKESKADPLVKFAVAPQFDESKDEESGERVFTSKYLTYRVAASRPADAGIASRYREFSDASARLNSLVNRGSLPPFPRMAVNEALAQAGETPDKVHLRVAPRQWIGGHTVVLHSEHEFRPRLMESDLLQINEAGEAMAAARRVPLSEYLKAAESD